MKADKYLSDSIKWNATGDAEFPYRASVDGTSARIRLNDFPAENLYTLIVGNAEVGFNDWPASWSRSTNKKLPKQNGLGRGRLAKSI